MQRQRSLTWRLISHAHENKTLLKVNKCFHSTTLHITIVFPITVFTEYTQPASPVAVSKRVRFFGIYSF